MITQRTFVFVSLFTQLLTHFGARLMKTIAICKPNPRTVLRLYPMSLEARRIRMNTTSQSPVPEYRIMRSTNRIFSTLTLTVLLASTALQASADTVFFDDFSDGDAQDGIPVTWTEAIGGDYDATSGDYVLTATPGGGVMLSTVVDITLTDFSIRTQVRTSSELGTVYVVARVQEPLVFPRSGSYFGALDYNPNFGGTRLILGIVEADSLSLFGDLTVLPFDVRIDDAVLQLDVIGNELKLWVWKAGDPVPDQPQLTATDNTYSEGTMRIVNDKENLNIGTFRYVHVADSHIPIPEPTTLLLAMFGMAGTCCFRRRR
jgi:hypothetical protein